MTKYDAASIEIVTGQEVVGRALGRAMVASMNFMVLNVATAILRQEKQIDSTGWVSLNEEVPFEDPNNPTAVGGTGIDGLNNQMAQEEAAAEALKVREEQGLPAPMNPWEHAVLLRTLTQYISGKLAAKASKQQSYTRPGMFFLNPWDLADPIEATIDFQILQTKPRDLDSRMKAEAKALNVPLEEIQEATKRRLEAQALFLTENKAALVAIVSKMDAEVGSPVDDDAAQAAWDLLPALTKLRLYAAGDRGMFRQAHREAISYIQSNRLLGKTMNGILNGERRELRKVIERFEKTPTVKRELDQAFAGGAAYPIFLPLEVEQKVVATTTK